MYESENKPSAKRYEAVLNDLFGEIYTIKGNDKIPGKCKLREALIQAAQNQKQTNKGSLVKLLKLKIGAKVMLTVEQEILAVFGWGNFNP